MKSGFILFFSLIFLLPEAFSQDLITTKTGRDISGLVQEVTKTAIIYQRNDSVFTIPKAEIFMVKYANGSKADYGAKNTAKAEALLALQAGGLSVDSLRKTGFRDAAKHYRGYKDAATGTFISTLLFPPAGLIVAVGTASTIPNTRNLNYPSDMLAADRDYAAAYLEKSHKKKKEYVWTNFGIGLGVSALIGLFVIPIARHL